MGVDVGDEHVGVLLPAGEQHEDGDIVLDDLVGDALVVVVFLLALLGQQRAQLPQADLRRVEGPAQQVLADGDVWLV